MKSAFEWTASNVYELITSFPSITDTDQLLQILIDKTFVLLFDPLQKITPNNYSFQYFFYQKFLEEEVKVQNEKLLDQVNHWEKQLTHFSKIQHSTCFLQQHQLPFPFSLSEIVNCKSIISPSLPPSAATSLSELYSQKMIEKLVFLFLKFCLYQVHVTNLLLLKQFANDLFFFGKQWYEEEQQFSSSSTVPSISKRLMGLLYFKYSTCCNKEEEYTAEYEMLCKSIHFCPYFAATYNNRGNYYNIQLESYNAALFDFTQAIDLFPNIIYYENRGDLYANYLNDETKAVNDYNNAVELAKANDISKLGSVYVDLALLYANKTEETALDNAEKYFEMAVQVNPKDPEIQISRIDFLYSRYNNLNNTIQLLQQAFEITDKKSESILMQLAQYYEKAKEFNNALQALNLALELNPTSSEVLLRRGILNEKVWRNYITAFRDYHFAIQNSYPIPAQMNARYGYCVGIFRHDMTEAMTHLNTAYRKSKSKPNQSLRIRNVFYGNMYLNEPYLKKHDSELFYDSWTAGDAQQYIVYLMHDASQETKNGGHFFEDLDTAMYEFNL